MSAADATSPIVSEDRADACADVGELYRVHGNWLIAFLRRRFDPRLAEDLAQETYVRAVVAGGQVHNPRAFLARVAVNAAYDQHRVDVRRMREGSGRAHAEALRTPSDQMEAVLLRQVILSLPPQLKEVFLLSRSAGLTYAEIAQHCGISVKTVEDRMTKALAMCMALVRD